MCSCRINVLLASAEKVDQELLVSLDTVIPAMLKPLLSLAVLALGAMTVAAGGREDVRKAAVLALVADRAIGLGAALADGLDDLVMLGGDVLAEARQVLRPEALEDLLDGTRLTALPSSYRGVLPPCRCRLAWRCVRAGLR